ncbi:MULTISPECIES: hypothetical protein, partial [Nostocales]
VEVIQLQNCSHTLALWRCCKVAVMFLYIAMTLINRAIAYPTDNLHFFTLLGNMVKFSKVYIIYYFYLLEGKA